ncbi:2Fe-2S iron-sulfur cluster-binding protein [Bordetella genomosp. 13]|uniref:2Fe-2S iron-sulfur cluster-binding protein n=1 Tax=Bordetella genomosp. 13 TaxID=463040 RepID=UPI0011A4DE5D|nr:2Fe-2S iron-sulfur cluster binding domain-containing protein [Bordetella genomosp. 13]
MSSVPITLLFSDGASRRVPAQCGQSIVQAAADAGLGLLTDCGNGQCGTCVAQLVSGEVELGKYDRAVLPDGDREAGAILACVSRVAGPCVVELAYDLSEACAEDSPPVSGRVIALQQVARETMRLDVELDQAVEFQPGQYVRIRPEGEEQWRSYSMAGLSGQRRLTFYIRLVEGGRFSSWLGGAAAVGSAVEVSEPHGSFFLRDEDRPRLFVAGGTGLAPFLSMLAALAENPGARAIPTTLLVGVRSGAHLFALEQLGALRAAWPELQVRLAAEAEPQGDCHQGYATDLIASLNADPRTRVYLCGPPAMVEAGRQAAHAAGLSRQDMLCERFN